MDKKVQKSSGQKFRSLVDNAKSGYVTQGQVDHVDHDRDALAFAQVSAQLTGLIGVGENGN